MSSAGYSSSSLHWSRWSPSILAWPQKGQASSAARSSQGKYIPKKSCTVVVRKRVTASALSSKKWAFVQSLLDGVETDQARVEPYEIMNINPDRKGNLRKEHETFELKEKFTNDT
ncbi:hypothetical protein TNCV_3385771 [Trichonephila clavipes]|uniref:Uncharacterized protein n=1 Tax=Trichonephila clavipes TaxID=2585209 RepID=A0A8X6SR86_TRICX|nr:hypothetical protein TNCV_3385771 [Trichonephila clavipes]